MADDKTPRFEAPDMMTALDALYLYHDNHARGMFALLGVCWRGMPRPAVRYDPRHPERYADAVMQWCVERKYKLAQLTAWAQDCYQLCTAATAALVSDDEVGNSDAG